MRTGANGCRWVCMGAMGCIGTETHKNKAGITQNGPTGHAFGPMVGEISPDIMFWDSGQKSGTDG